VLKEGLKKEEAEELQKKLTEGALPVSRSACRFQQFVGEGEDGSCLSAQHAGAAWSWCRIRGQRAW
jgi:hypothetical protein